MNEYKVQRCKRHATVPHHNLNAEDGTAECGACVMAEVYFMFHTRLELLDTMADLFRAHAELRTALSKAQGELEFYRGNFTKTH